VSLPQNFAVFPDNHHCSKPDLPKVGNMRNFSHDTVIWICPECKSEWQTYLNSSYWTRNRDSSAEWKAEEKIRLEKALAEAMNAPPAPEPVPVSAKERRRQKRLARQQGPGRG